jgi:hypothetical protein
MQGISFVAEDVLAFQEGLYSKELVSKLVSFVSTILGSNMLLRNPLSL